MARQGRLVENQARKVISDIFSIGNQDQLPRSTIKDFLTAWLRRKELEAGQQTHTRYGIVVDQFLKFLGGKKARDIAHLTSADISGFRDAVSERSAPSTVNVALKVIRAALNQAKREGLIDSNEAERVSLLKRVARSKRRPFSLDELRRVLEMANQEWVGIILVGLYTGLRLGDIATLTWTNVDLGQRELHLVTQKTGRSQNLPIAKPLLKHLESLPVSDDPHQPLFPSAYDLYTRQRFNGTLSRQFYDILVAAGLAKERVHAVTGKGSLVRHVQNELSFHCLRHTATSLLKNAGVSDVIARDIIGHDSEAVSRQYTHIETETKRRALDNMPDVMST